MPKVKTNSSAKKRFKVTGSGKITFQKAFKRHILTKKSTKRKRNMRIDGTVADANLHFVKRLLGMKQSKFLTSFPQKILQIASKFFNQEAKSKVT